MIPTSAAAYPAMIRTGIGFDFSMKQSGKNSSPNADFAKRSERNDHTNRFRIEHDCASEKKF
ncbi:hypothetical protein CH380_14955 [Leptospira adleri]|uniref:Uncharacterized protein n=1 Tax=Leptospira adleri TaxID=2023186 RepID=A0A2M9YLQ8_9LEPT|nr:hypothetical protein CH380_14955 [Leptospira adleri]